MPLAPLTHTICQASRLLFDRRKFAVVSRLRLTESLPGSRLPTSDCINRPRSAQRDFVGDGRAGPLHHERQRHDMGLTIHYQLTTTGDEAHARKLVQQLRQAALDLPLQHVGEIVEFQGDECDWKQRADDDPYRWLLIQAGTHIALPVEPWEKRQGVTRQLDVRPQHVIAFETEPGDGCEAANFGLCQFPSELSHPEFGKAQDEAERLVMAFLL